MAARPWPKACPVREITHPTACLALDSYQKYLDLCGQERIIPEMDRNWDWRMVPDPTCRRLGIPADPEPDWSDPGPWLDDPHALAG